MLAVNMILQIRKDLGVASCLSSHINAAGDSVFPSCLGLNAHLILFIFLLSSAFGELFSSSQFL